VSDPQRLAVALLGQERSPQNAQTKSIIQATGSRQLSLNKSVALHPIKNFDIFHYLFSRNILFIWFRGGKMKFHHCFTPRKNAFGHHSPMEKSFRPKYGIANLRWYSSGSRKLEFVWDWGESNKTRASSCKAYNQLHQWFLFHKKLLEIHSDVMLSSS